MYVRLVEVNASPSLSTTTEADRIMKLSLLRDIYNIVAAGQGGPASVYTNARQSLPVSVSVSVLTASCSLLKLSLSGIPPAVPESCRALLGFAAATGSSGPSSSSSSSSSILSGAAAGQLSSAGLHLLLHREE